MKYENCAKKCEMVLVSLKNKDAYAIINLRHYFLMVELCLFLGSFGGKCKRKPQSHNI